MRVDQTVGVDQAAGVDRITSLDRIIAIDRTIGFDQAMNADQRRAVDAILRHDRESSGTELVYYFVHELGVAEREAWRAVAQRWRKGAANVANASIPLRARTTPPRASLSSGLE